MYQMISPQILQQMYGQQGVSQQNPLGQMQGAAPGQAGMPQQGMPQQGGAPGMPNLSPLQGIPQATPAGGAGGGMPMGGAMPMGGPQQPAANPNASLGSMIGNGTKLVGAFTGDGQQQGQGAAPGQGNPLANMMQQFQGPNAANPNMTMAQQAAQQAATADNIQGVKSAFGSLASLFGSSGGGGAAPAMGGMY